MVFLSDPIHEAAPRRRCALAAILVALTAATPAPALTGKWVRAKTDYVEVFSDAAPREATEFAVHYSAFRFALIELLGERARKLPPSVVLLFRNGRDFTRTFAPPNSRDEMLSVSTDIDGVALLGQSLSGDQAQAQRLAFEFETTWGLPRLGYRLPLLVLQGSGKVFSTLELKNGVCRLGGFEMLQVDPWMDHPIAWPRFCAISPGSPEYRDPGDSRVVHSQAWAAMHFVWLGGPDSAERFERLAQALRDHRGAAQIEAAFGVPLRELTPAVKSHVQNFRRPREFRFDEAGVRARMESGPAQPAVAGIYFAELLIANQKAAAAARELAAAHALAPDLPLLREALARQAWRQGDSGKAVALYREAMQLGTSNFHAYVLSAQQWLNGVSGAGGDEAGGGGVFAEKALADVRRGIDLNPASEEAWRTLGRALFVLPELKREHIDELAVGIERADASGAVRLYRALLHERLGDFAAAEADLRSLIDRADASAAVREQAAERLDTIVFRAAVAEVERLVNARDFESARMRVRDLEAQLGARGEERVQRLSRWVERAAQRP